MAVTVERDEAMPPVAAPPTPPLEWHPSASLVPVALLLLGGGLALAGRDGLTATEVVRAALVVAWAVAGAVLVTRTSLRGLGIIVLAGVAAAALACLADAAVTAGGTGGPRSVADLALPLCVALLPATGLHLLLSLPVGSLGPRRRVGAGLGYALGVALGILLWSQRPALSTWPIWLAAAAALVGGLGPANRRYVRSAGLERQRLQWLGCALVVVAETALVVAALGVLVDWPPQGVLVAGAVSALLPLSLAAGASARLVTRVDRLLVHTVSFTGLSGVVVAVYLVIVLGLGRVPDDGERDLLVLSMVAAVVAAAVYLPARARLSEMANRLVYGEREAPDTVLRTFGSRLSRAIPMDELLLQLVESLRKTMALQAAEVWTGSAGTLVRTVSVPDRPPDVLALAEAELPVVARAGVSGPAWLAVWLPSLLAGRDADTQLRVAPVTHSGELLGLIVAERRSGDDAFTDEDERVLTELARQVGLALHNVALDSALQASLDEVRRQADELRASRARIVATADAERRRIERNLHDGAQQHLVALAVNLRLARDLVGDDPEVAAAMLEELATSIKDTIAELRDLAHGIYPPLLMDSGLEPALRAAASRSPLEVEVEVDDVGRFPTEVEAAVYFCGLEALQNAAKHAPDSRVRIRVWCPDDVPELRFEVTDDGPGFDADQVGRGHGFVNMSDRLGAIGGTVTWDSTPGHGAVISGSIPR